MRFFQDIFIMIEEAKLLIFLFAWLLLEGNAALVTFFYSQWNHKHVCCRNLLFKLLRDNICFMYSKDRNKSQLLCSRSVIKEDLDEKPHSNDLVNVCAKLPR